MGYDKRGMRRVPSIYALLWAWLRAAPLVMRFIVPLAILLAAAPALGRHGLAVLPFQGEPADAAITPTLEKRVVQNLEVLDARGALRLIRPERWRGEMRRHPKLQGVEPDNFAAGARDLNLKAALAGQIVTLGGTRQLVLDFIDPQGRLLLELVYPLPAAGPPPESTVTALLKVLPTATEQALGLRPLPPKEDHVASLPPPSLLPGGLRGPRRSPGGITQAADEEDPFYQKPAPVAPPPPPRDPRAEISASLLVGGRSLVFGTAGRPGQAWGLAPGLAVALRVSPLPGPYLRGLGAEVSAAAFEWPALHGSDGSRFARDELRVHAGLGYRLDLPRSFAVGLGLHYGLHRYTINSSLQISPALDPVPPGVDYRYLAISLGAQVPLLVRSDRPRQPVLALEVSGAYHRLFSAGAITDESQYGAMASSVGWQAGGAVRFQHRPLWVRLGMFAEGYQLRFDPLAAALKRSTDAEDLFLTGVLSVGAVL